MNEIARVKKEIRLAQWAEVQTVSELIIIISAKKTDTSCEVSVFSCYSLL